MSAFGQNRPVFLKTYGKQKRKVEQWFSPDVRKKAFSFSTTPSSDPSLVEFERPTKRRSKAKVPAKALRLAKERALSALREPDSDEENLFIPEPPASRKTSARPVRKATAKKTFSAGCPNTSDTRTRNLPLSHHGRNSSGTKKRTEWREQGGAPSVGRFVTRRRRAQRLSSSSRGPPLSVVPSDVPLQVSLEWAESCEHPLFSSTPSVGERRNAIIVEISSLSGEDSDRVLPEGDSRNPQLHLDSQTEPPIEGSPSVGTVAPLGKPDFIRTSSGRPPDEMAELQEVSTSGPTYATASSQETINPCFQPVYLSSSTPRCSPFAQALMDRLEMECLTSCPVVRLQPLSPSLLRRESPQDGLSASTGEAPAPASPVPAGPMCIDPPRAALQERPTGPGTTRKAGVSGLSAGRWSRRGASGAGDPGRRPRRRANETQARNVLEDSSLNYLTAGGGVEPNTGGSMWALGLPATPLRQNLNLSYILANFSPDALTTQNWGRLKAALSVHKKKKAIPTPRRLALSGLASPGPSDFSLDLFDALPGLRLGSSWVSCDEEDLSDAEKVYHECRQDGPITFEDCIPPDRLGHCMKIGEGTFGEVFSVPDDTQHTVALKIIPVEGQHKVNGEAQKSFGEILHEIIISKELSMLSGTENNRTSGFIGLNNLHCVRGRYPPSLLAAWDRFDSEKASENDRPDFFDDEQLFVILEFEFGGSDLENMRGKLSSLAQAKSILHQVTAALAVAEQALHFEHRDLHWGNILVKTTKEKQTTFVLNGAQHSVETRGLHINIIDYSLSRLQIDGLTVSCDISNDEELFMGQGDYQFEIYRLMKKENNNTWSDYNPHSNVLWLHYLTDKLMSMKYKSKQLSGQQKAIRSSLRSFQQEILGYSSATDALTHCALFK